MSRIVGAHVSASGGFEKAAERAAKLGCNALQLFTGSPRIWKSKQAKEFDYESFLVARRKLGIERAIIHATYLVNLASDNPALVEKSVSALINDMTVCALGQFDGVVVHLGSHQGRGYEAMRGQLVEQIKVIIDATPEGSVFLIENSAGQKGKIASDLAEVKDLLDGVKSERLGWCVDTCHLHAGGYLLGKSGIQKEVNEELMSLPGLSDGGDKKEAETLVVAEEITRLDLWQSLKCVHVNESKDGFGSGRDRHENLGEGIIGSEAIGEFLNSEELEQVPLILEVPGFDGKGPDKENVEILKDLVR